MTGFKNLRKCFVIAEISANHNQHLSQAILLIKKAKACGADAVKFQAYTPDTMTINARNKYFRIRHTRWAGQTLYELYRSAYTPWQWFKKLKQVADDLGIVFFATAFDKTSVDFLEALRVPIYKIASFELVDLPLIEYTAKTRKPLILSTGMATAAEKREAVSAAREAGAKDMALLKCVSSYPASLKDMNLASIPDMSRLFKVPVGLSDHTLGMEAAVVAVSLGARIVEKHFTLSRRVKGPDSFFSIQPEELKKLVNAIRAAEKCVGSANHGFSDGEKRNKIFRRSLFVVEDINRGELFTEKNVRSIRPGYGLHPRYLGRVIGKRAAGDIKRGMPLSLGMIKK